MGEPSFLRPQRQRQLGDMQMSDLHTDYSAFEGEWFDCFHTKLMTFNGVPAAKHTINSVECDGGLFGTVTPVSDTSSQTLQMDLLRLNHCFFHGMGPGLEKECPNDRIDSDSRGDGNVKVIQQMQGIGSFAGKGDQIKFFTDRTWVHGGDGLQHEGDDYSDYYSDGDRAKLENKDTMVCTVYGPGDGIVCDWEINEVRVHHIHKEGCMTTKSNGKEKAQMKWSKKKCEKKGGEWSGKAKTETIENGFSYDSFGSYFLVQDRTKCVAASTNEYCPNANDRPDLEDKCTEGEPCTTGPTPTPIPVPVPGCYRGGRCGEDVHGCCDCLLNTAEKCEASGYGTGFNGTHFDEDGEKWTTTPIFSQKCGNICKHN